MPIAPNLIMQYRHLVGGERASPQSLCALATRMRFTLISRPLNLNLSRYIELQSFVQHSAAKRDSTSNVEINKEH